MENSGKKFFPELRFEKFHKRRKSPARITGDIHARFDFNINRQLNARKAELQCGHIVHRVVADHQAFAGRFVDGRKRFPVIP